MNQNLFNINWPIKSTTSDGVMIGNSKTENNHNGLSYVYTEYGLSPFGDNKVIWNVSSSDKTYSRWSGFGKKECCNYISIDNTKNYRFSLYFKKTSNRGSNNVTLYYGFKTFDSSNDEIDVYDLDNNSNTGNPYFSVFDDLSEFNQGEWYLMVGYILNANFSGSYSSYYTKVYDMNGNQVSVSDIWWDRVYKFNYGTKKVDDRWFELYVSPSSVGEVLENFQFWNPELYVMDGNEPPILYYEKIVKPIINSNNKILLSDTTTTITHLSYKTDDLILNLDAGDSDSYPGTGTVWYDISGNDNHAYGHPGDEGGGTNSANFPTYQTNDGGRFYFDGNNGLNITSDLGNQTYYTVDAWYYKNHTGHNYLLDFRNSSGDYWFWDYYSHNINVNNILKYSNSSVLLYKWANVTIVRNGSITKLYINGSEVTPNNNGTISNILGSNVSIGSRFTFTNSWIGWMSNIRIYNTVLTDTEISNNYDYFNSRLNGTLETITTNKILTSDGGLKII